MEGGPGIGGSYIVILCPRCGSIRYAEDWRKTAKCFNCGYRIRLRDPEVRILYKTGRRDEAVEAVKRYKMMIGAGRRQPSRSKP